MLEPAPEKPPKIYGGLAEKARAAFVSGRTKPIESRKQHLKQLLKLVDEQSQLFGDPLEENLLSLSGRSYESELGTLKAEVAELLDNLEEWCRDAEDDGTRVQPMGVVLVYAGWNSALLTLFRLVAYAIAAGNCVALEPTMLSQCYNGVADCIGDYLEPDWFSMPRTDANFDYAQERYDFAFYNGHSNLGVFKKDEMAKHYPNNRKNIVYIEEFPHESFSKFVLHKLKCKEGIPETILCKTSVKTEVENVALEIFKTSDLSTLANALGLKNLDKQEFACKRIFYTIFSLICVDNAEEVIRLVNIDVPFVLTIISDSKQIVDKLIDETGSAIVVVNDSLDLSEKDVMRFGTHESLNFDAIGGKDSFYRFCNKKKCFVNL